MNEGAIGTELITGSTALSALEVERREQRKAKLTAARKKKQLENHEKVREAFIAMEAERIPVTASGIAVRAGVARQTVYNSPYIKEIQDAAQRTAVNNRSSMRSQASDESLMRRLENANEHIRKLIEGKARLKEENKHLKEQRDSLLAQMRKPETR